MPPTLDHRRGRARSSASRTGPSGYYEDLGLISPERRGTRRVYHRRDRMRLGLILRGKRLGFPLEEIRTIVDMYDAAPGEVGPAELPARPDRRAAGPTSSSAAGHRRTLAELGEFERRCREDLDKLA